jgi:DNA-binding CsgD family transcriptional regulator
VIAEKLSLKTSTVNRHLAAIHKKFGKRSSLEILCLLNAKKQTEGSMIRLTPRGEEVFVLITQGLTIRQIGERLGISSSGVLRHKEKMLLQNSCASTLELVAKYHGKVGEMPADQCG